MTVTPIHPNRKDRTQVEALSGMGATAEFIASHLNLSLDDLQKHYPHELQHGPEEANLRVARTLFDMATSGEHPQATVAWLKMRAGWSDVFTQKEEEDPSTQEEAREKLLTLLNRAHK